MFSNSDNYILVKTTIRLVSFLCFLFGLFSTGYAQTTVTVENYAIDRSTGRTYNPLAIPRFQLAPLSEPGQLAIYMANGFPTSSVNFHLTNNLDSSVRWVDVYNGVNYPLDHSHISVYKDTFFVGMNSDGRMYAYTVQNSQITQLYNYDWNLPLADLYIAAVLRVPNSDTTLAVTRGYGEAQIRKSLSTNNGQSWSPLSYLVNWESAGRCRIGGLQYDNTVAFIADSADYSIVWFTWDRTAAEWIHEGKVFHRPMYRGFAGNVIEDTIRFVVGTINDAGGDRDSVICAYRSKNASSWTEGPAFQTSNVDLGVPPYTALTYIEASKRLVLFYTQANVPNDNEIDIYMRYWKHGDKQWSEPTVVSRGNYSWKVTTAQRVPASHGDVCYAAYPMDSAGYHYADLVRVTFTEDGGDDSTPPGKINDLSVTLDEIFDEIVLEWTAPGDDGFNGTAAEYTIKYSPDSLESDNWNGANSWTPAPIPSMAGSPESIRIDGLPTDQYIYFAITAKDEVGNESEISNNAVLSPPNIIDNDENSLLPTLSSLATNYPNPFNLSTTIEYTVESNMPAELSIYDILGQHIKTFVNTHTSFGTYSIHWDGTDEEGNFVPSGVYLYKLRSGHFEEAKKLVLLK
ncbi:MAG TPA: T9SS type A sorting domain-containing protein [candidate division Zixibacteria bacterium]|nr:T9SS type A sorting domain-containing protein [candidate division Zixibacteria bacterium]